tara:strand:- start:57 stop:440 length:384 start_codon:yes stop_codon:yes gene_type:complete
MPEDFYDHMKKEKELLNLSYQESLRQKSERMAVWEPIDKMTVLSQIKKLINAWYRGLKGWVVRFYPGILLILVFLVFGLLAGCTTMNWPWKEKEEVRLTNPLVIPPSEENTIACIKLEPECNSDLEN